MAEPGIILTQQAAEEYLRRQKPWQDEMSEYRKSIEYLNKQASDMSNQYGNLYNNQLQNIYSAEGTNRYALGNEFSQGMEQIAANALASKESFMGTNIGTGQQERMSSDLEKSVLNAYNTYFNNYMAERINLSNQTLSDKSSAHGSYLGNLQQLESDKSAAINELNKGLVASNELLVEDAKNMSLLQSKPMEYLMSLIKDNPNLYQDKPEFSKYFKHWYQDGNLIVEPRTDDELDAIFYNRDEHGNITGLTKEGVDFYNQILYSENSGFNDWLYDTDKNLWEWANTENKVGKYTNKTGQSTNKAMTFGVLGLDNVVKNETYTGFDTRGSEYAYSKPLSSETFENSTDFGTVRQYNSSTKHIISVMDDLDIRRVKTNKEKNKDDFVAVYKSKEDDKNVKRKYKLTIKKGGDFASDEVYNDIVNVIGGVPEVGKIYVYDRTAYIGITSNNVTKLREIEFRDGKDAFFETLSNAERLKVKNEK